MTTLHHRPCDIADLLAIAAPYVARDLISPRAWLRIAAIPALLPRALAAGGFSCALDGRDDRVGFHTLLVADRRDRDALRAALSAPGAAQVWSECGWAATRAFLCDWTRPDAAICTGVDAVALEFELGEALPARARPAVSFLGAAAPGGGPGRRTLEPAWHAGLRLLCGGGAAARWAAALNRLGDVLWPDERLAALTVPPDGGDAIVRASLAMPSPRVDDFVGRIGWRGSGEQRDAIRAVTAGSGELAVVEVALDGPGAGALRLGFEVEANDEERWSAGVRLLDILLDLDACTAAARAVVLSWPASGRDAAVGEGSPLAVERSLRLELAFRPGELVAARALLRVGPVRQAG